MSAGIKYILTIGIVLITIVLSQAKLTLIDVHTASDKILVVHFTSDTLDVNESNIENISDWKINGQQLKAISRYVTPADECDHFIYLQTSPFREGNEYTLQTPYGQKTFRFSERDILCESIKVNQVGYSALSKTRYAYFAIWLGTDGAQKIEGTLPEYEVINPATGDKISKGKLKEISQDSSSGDFVYRINLSDVPEGGPYKIIVNGYGASYPFGVGGEFSKKLAYTIFRAQYLQRCGCPINIPDIRKKPCHTLIYDVDGPIGEANIVVKGDERTFACYGGYHDAGDADRRAYHLINPIVNLMIYEAFPSLFSDGQYDVPGTFDEHYNIVSYTNNIPDIIDEAAWGTLVWEYLQNKDGSVHFGTETKGYPDPFAAPLDQDNKKYGTVKVDPRATCTSAGLFMHLARILKAYDPKHSDELFQRAEKAMAFGESDMAKPEKLYYNIQKYLLTGDEKAHQSVKELYKVVDSYPQQIFATTGYSLNDDKFDNPAYIYSYIIEKNIPTDPVIVAYFKNALKSAADNNIEFMKTHVYPVGSNVPEGRGMPWGHNVKQPKYACAPLLYWSLSGEQKYFDAASQLMDYKLGLNPLGISYVTALGTHQIHNPHDRESAYTKSLGWGPKPGITIFGPGVRSRWRKLETVPTLDKLPRERMFADDLGSISFTEFTIFETMAYDALYTVLCNGGKWDGSDPFNIPQK